MHYPELDEKLENIMGKYSDASGLGFGQRDAAWYFKHSKQAFEKFKRLRKLRNLDTIQVTWDVEDDVY